jgi:hypothetical protein
MSLAHKLVADHGDVQFFHDERRLLKLLTSSPISKKRETPADKSMASGPSS